MTLRMLAASLGALLLALPAASAAGPDMAELAARVDRGIRAAWDKSVQPAAAADDAEFFRRVHLDLAGRIPSITEVRDFLDDDRPGKRRLWVDRILQADADDASYRDAYVNHFANVWRGRRRRHGRRLQRPAGRAGPGVCRRELRPEVPGPRHHRHRGVPTLQRRVAP